MTDYARVYVLQKNSFVVFCLHFSLCSRVADDFIETIRMTCTCLIFCRKFWLQITMPQLWFMLMPSRREYGRPSGCRIKKLILKQIIANFLKNYVGIAKKGHV